LSVVADAVVAATGSQSALVLRLPKNKFLMARPNTGHLLAAALLREQSISCLLTLNFDLAMNAALSMVGGESDVSVIAGPKDHSDLGQTNLVYLHGNASSQPEDWVLTTDALGHQEYLDWRGVIVGKVLGGPVTVFAGLGARSAVLIETTRAISDAVKDAQVFQVDKAPHGTTAFSEELNLPAADHILNRPGEVGDSRP